MKPPRSIVILSPAFPLRGGIAASTERLAYEWQRMGRSVTIYSFKLQYPELLFPGKTQFADGDPPAELNIETAIHSLNPLNWVRVGRAIAEMQPELIVSRYWLPFMAPSLGSVLRIAARNGARRIALVDNLVPHEPRLADDALTHYFCRSVDGFVVMSRLVEHQIKARIPDANVRFVPHPIYDNYGEPLARAQGLAELNLPAEPRYLLFFGFVRRYKGLDLLLRALADPRLRARNLKLVVAGEFYEDEVECRALIRSLGIEDRVILHDRYISNEQVRFYFAAADLVVQPYRTATQSGISQMAYHFERPMVVTRVGGLPEIVEHGCEGFVVDVAPDAIAEAIEESYVADRFEPMRAAVKKRKTDFSWDRLVGALENAGFAQAS